MSSGQLYKPFVSDSDYESDTDSEVFNDGYISEESLLNLPGRDKPVETATPALIPAKGAPPQPDISVTGTKFETAESRNTFLITINSRDRDTNVYPLPTFFTIRLPRVLRNIKQINIQQLNLLNSFFNFTAAKGNTFMFIRETGRTRVENGIVVPNDVKINIRTGTYTADDLVVELTNALNNTPLFSGITFGDFSTAFRNTGNFSLLFNTPGPIVFNSMTQSYDRNQTIGNIVARYFQTVQTVGTISYTDAQIAVAYYYPIIKEMIIAQPFPVPFDVGGQNIPTGFTSWYDYLVFAFQGVSDPYVTRIVAVPDNIPIFTSYRNANTFNSFLVNKYTCTYNSKQGRLIISAPSLNDSITTDLTSAYNNFLNVLVVENGFANLADFQNQYNSIQNLNGSLIEFYNYIQRQFATYFGVNFGMYSDVFYQNLSNEIMIYNTLNRYGWNTSANPFQLQIQSNSPPTQISTLWSNIVFPQVQSNSLLYGSTNTYFMSTLTPPNFTSNILAFSNSGEATFGYTDINFRLLPTTYDRVAFKSRCRQNISLMTIPRYITQRGAGTDMVFNLGCNTTPLLFTSPAPSTFYIYSDISGNLLFNMYTVQQVMFFDAPYMRAFDEWLSYIRPQFTAGNRIQENDPAFYQPPPITSVTLTSFRPATFVQVNADQYPAAPNAHFNIDFYVETQDGNPFPVPIVITWYKDRAVFMADAEADLGGAAGGESPRNYFKRQTYMDLSSAVMTVDVDNLQTTYFHINFASTTNLPSSVPLRIFALLTDNYGVYTSATYFNTYGLPWSNLPSLADQFTPASPIYENPTRSIYDNSVTQIGYDISGVSNNLLDYLIQSGSNYYDPVGIQDYESASKTGLRYVFVAGTNGAPQPAPTLTSNSPWSLYFFAGSSNVIRDTYNNVNNVYLAGGQTPKPLPTGTSNEFSLANWLQPASAVKEQFLQAKPITSGGYQNSFTIGASTASVFLPCINTSTATLVTDASTTASYFDLSGVSAVGFFLPPDSIVKLDSMLLKFAFMQPVTDSNNGLYSRSNTAVNSLGYIPNGNIYRTQTTAIQTSNSVFGDWDDWYLFNRRNVKLGIFRAGDLHNSSFTTLGLSNALMTMTLQKVTQVGSFQNQATAVRTREPDWGTYYVYAYDSNPATIWDVASVNLPTAATSTINASTYWRSINVSGDTAPVYIAGQTSTLNYFFTVPNINNYTYLPRSYGIGPSVGNAVDYPTAGVSSYTTDIPNGFAAVPFYFDAPTSTFKVGSFYGLSYTRTPMLPSTSLIGAAPYYGPPGPFGWYKFPNTSTFRLVEGDQPSFKPYYWDAKVEFKALDAEYNPATDLSLFGNFPGISNELQDTVMFLYENNAPGQPDVQYASTVQVAGGRQYWKWGQESASNYIAWDDQNGYNFLSYIYNVQVRSNAYGYATQVRAYDPIPAFNTGIRFIGKNYTDFGNPTLYEIGTEIASLSSYRVVTDTQANLWVQNPGGYPTSGVSTFSTNAAVLASTFISHEYADALKVFDVSFSTSFVFGRKPGYAGNSFVFSGYSNAINQYAGFASTTRGSLVLYTNILSTATGQLNTYVLDRYGSILPSSIISRNRITDPLPFSLLFSTMTLPPYKFLPDEWGLGWNLGFAKRDTIPRTTVTSDTFIRITQDYIYLRLNPEFNTNTLAVSGKENLSESREAQSQDTRYFSKILLNNFGGFSRAAVQLPKVFNPVLGKYDTVRCQLVDQFGVQLSNTDCDYDFVLEVTEIDQRPTDTASLVLPKTANQLEIVSRQSGNK